MIRRFAILWMSVILSGLGIVALAVPASARKPPTITGVGPLSCSISGEIDFDPALTYNGQPVVKGYGPQKETATVSIDLSNCTGPDSNTPQPNPVSATSTSNHLVHIKSTKSEMEGYFFNVLGDCGDSDFEPGGTFKGTEAWFDSGPSVEKTKLVLSINTTGGPFSGTSSMSYAGSATGTLNLTDDSLSDYNSVCNGDPDGNGSVSQLDFDPSTSNLTIGVPSS